MNLRQLFKGLEPTGLALIDGELVEASSGERFQTTSPLDGSVLAHVASCGPDEIDQAVTVARRAFESREWSGTHPRTRKRVLHRFADLLLEYRDELGLLITLDMGKPVADARGEVESSVRELRFFAESVDKIVGDVVPTNDDALGTMSFEAAGVVGAITPWNFPIMMPIYKIGPALAMGNSVVLKPAEQSPLAAIRLGQIALEAGLPKGVLNVVPGFAEAGQALALHMDVDVLAFTGSTAVGKKLLVYSGQSNMKSVWLECGGKSANIVLADAPDLRRAAQFAASGIFHGAGQVCNAGSRLVVEGAIYDTFVEMVLEEAQKYFPRDPLDEESAMGTLVDAEQLERVLGRIQQAIDEGAKLRLGGGRVLAESGGCYIEPTVFVDVEPDMQIAQEEVFGPVLSIIRLKDGEDPVRIANDSKYGLAAAVWTSNLTRAHRIARSLQAGTVYINTYDKGDNSLPFGGFKQSGIGVDRSMHALEKYAKKKTTWMDLTQ